MIDSAALLTRLADVKRRIAAAASRAGRDPASIRLVAVSKTYSAEHVRALALGGQADFGENKVQEALQKQAATSDLPIRWHLVGHLQSNKARKAATMFDVIHSLDDRDLLMKLDQAAVAAARPLDLLVQVDLAGEPTKHGAREEALAPIFEAAHATKGAHIVGLMLLPPAVSEPERARPQFRALVAVRDRLRAAGVAPSMLQELSMGMSDDFEVAVEEGATLVRIGTALFGRRSGPIPTGDASKEDE